MFSLQTSRILRRGPALRGLAPTTPVRSYAKNVAPNKARNKYAHLQEDDRVGVKGNTNKEKLQEAKEKLQDPKAKKKKSSGHGDPTNLVFVMKGLTKFLPNNTPIFEKVFLTCFYGAKVGVLGLNGAGKSTLMKIIAGVDDDFEGELDFPGKPRIGYLEQEPVLDDSLTVFENVLDGLPAEKAAALKEFYQLKSLIETEGEKEVDEHTLSRFQELTELVTENNWTESKWQIERALMALRCPDPSSSVTYLSGGERRRVALIRLLISNPDLLLLDEPTNHLDAESVAWLERFLSSYKGTVIAITHDRYFLDNVAGWILEVEAGRCHPFEGNYSSWLLAKQARLNLEKQREKVLSKQLETELAWINKNPKGRQAKSKARIDRYDDLLKQQKNCDYVAGTIFIPPGPRLGELVIHATDLSRSVDDGNGNIRTLFSGVSFKLERAGILGIIGPNGVGKTSLLRIIAGEEQPDSGELKVGSTVKIGYASQSRRDLKDYNTVFEEISEGYHELKLGNRMTHMRSYVASFQFSGPNQQKYVSDLSGGERNRIHLAKMLKDDNNVLLLDEPTNDIDVEVLRSLEDGLQDYPGCVVVVSHDRWFLDRICTHILAFEDDGKVIFYEGNYSQYEEDLKQRLAKEGKQIKKFAFINVHKQGQKFGE